MNYDNKNKILISETSVSRRQSPLPSFRKYGYTLHRTSENFKNDKEVVLEAVGNNGYLLYDASEELRNDKEVIPGHHPRGNLRFS